MTIRTVEEIRMRDLARSFGGQYAWAMAEIDRWREHVAALEADKARLIGEAMEGMDRIALAAYKQGAHSRGSS